MSFLTQAFLDFETASRLRLLDSYDWHQLVWRAFPGRDGQTRDFLTRLDRRQAEGNYRLLILSAQPPLRPEEWPTETDAWQTREIPPSFLAHPCYRFHLRANPTRRDNASRKRVPLRTDGELRAWLERKGEQNGFAADPEALRILQEGRRWFRKAGRERFHHAVDFEGTLRVRDPATFAAGFAKGIGSAKAFGFGLLALVPVGQTTT
ncbi:MAG: type I-E CRISPR-associated protein Cas6/Cse3/CasE [Lentisphaeria bacterium]|nr:type I-E CRISPR-associated protein Cas6/Cse3/CasE [Lentisphaeria bacterium]